MSFDMSAGDIHEHIDHDEEIIFDIAFKQSDRFPTLMMVWDNYYNDPLLCAVQARELASELTELLTLNEIKSNVKLAASVIRLAAFFKAVHLENQGIHCLSD